MDNAEMKQRFIQLVRRHPPIPLYPPPIILADSPREARVEKGQESLWDRRVVSDRSMDCVPRCRAPRRF